MNILENAMAKDLNREFSSIFGEEKNWFSILINSCKRFVSGGDILALASDLAWVILKDEKFIFLMKESKTKSSLFYSGCYIRAKNLIKFYKSKSISLSGKGEDGDFSDIIPSINKERLELDEVIRSVINHFKDDEYLRQVASLRFENGDFNSINYIAERLNLKKGGRLLTAIDTIDKLCKKKLVG